MRNIKLLLEYEGTNYAGWQRQENGRTIQGEIESALAQILQEQVSVIGAGRTDAGVHARGQVANFPTETALDLGKIKGGLNSVLPEDIVIHKVEEAASDFHARYSAKERVYSYLISLEPAAMLRNYSWHVKFELDIDLMRQASSKIIGEHDFQSFCRAIAGIDHHRCIVSSTCWRLDGSNLQFTIAANRFLHGMVRALVGTMVDIGRGYTSLDEFTRILSASNRAEAGMSAPPKGLVLEKVVY